MRKAQASQIFVYAITAVMAAITLIFGYRAITSVTSSSDKIMLNEFRVEFARDVDIASSFGSVQQHTYRLPGTVEELCIIDRSGDSGTALGNIDRQKHPLIYDSWESTRDYQAPSIFLVPGEVQFTVEAVHVAPRDALGRRPNSSTCFPVHGAVTVTMFGEGNATRIENG